MCGFIQNWDVAQDMSIFDENFFWKHVDFASQVDHNDQVQNAWAGLEWNPDR